MLHVQVLVAMAAWLVQPPLPPMTVQRHPAAAVVRSSVLRAAAEFANDGEETDWDEEAKKLGDLAKPMNRFYKEISGTEAPELIKDFVNSAPSEVQFAVKTTVSALLGNLPAKVAESTITTTGKNLATLMFNMQITGYMVRAPHEPHAPQPRPLTFCPPTPSLSRSCRSRRRDTVSECGVQAVPRELARQGTRASSG